MPDTDLVAAEYIQRTIQARAFGWQAIRQFWSLRALSCSTEPSSIGWRSQCWEITNVRVLASARL